MIYGNLLSCFWTLHLKFVEPNSEFHDFKTDAEIKITLKDGTYLK